MHDVLPHLRWDDENVFSDINRKMPAWGVPIADLSLEPNTGILANGSDAFNGSYSPHQVPSCYIIVHAGADVMQEQQ